ncbi:MAG: hypothetical protein K0R60_586 [Microbacterium sp.]|nr:hypothetical protein [Microbacterium sp.]MDF2554691.1 hypothetical protein [Microbacterium sp.]
MTARRRARRLAGIAVALVVLTALGACAAAPSPEATSPVPADPVAPTPRATESAPAATPDDAPEAVVGTVLRFSSDRTHVDVVVGEDSPAVRDFLSMLPLQVPFEEFAGREKIAYLPRALAHAGSPGSDPEDGDLIYFTSWGNLGFYYNADGIDYSDATLHIGTYDATEQQLSLLEGDVSIDIVG